MHMTHFIGAVVVPQSIPVSHSENVESFLGSVRVKTTADEREAGYLLNVLSAFDENREMPRYLERTKEQIIADGRAEIEEYKNGRYAEYLKDPAAYAADCRPSHLEYVSVEFPKKLTWSDDEVYADQLQWADEEDIDEQGRQWSTTNPEGYWDWWNIGGRWTEEYREHQGETVVQFVERLRETLTAIEAGTSFRPAPEEGMALERPDELLPWWFPKNIVIPGETGPKWVRQGHVGWFGTAGSDLTEADWIRKLIEAVADCNENDTLVYIDFHV